MAKLDEARLESILLQSAGALVMAVDTLRKGGGNLGDYVLVVADLSDRMSWLVARDMNGGELHEVAEGGADGVDLDGPRTDGIARAARMQGRPVG